MKRIRKWLLVMGVTGPIVMNLSCSSVFLRTARDSVVAGTGQFVQSWTVNFLNGLVGEDGG